MSYQEAMRPGQIPQPPELDPTERFNQALLAKLKSFRPTFLDIRSSLGLGSEVGFGFIPSVHGAYTVGALPFLEKHEKGPERKRWYRPVLGHLLAVDYVPMTRADRDRIIIMPDTKTSKPRVVSIYQRKGYAENVAVEERLLTAPNEVIEGVIAHELTHMIRRRTRITRALRQRGIMDEEAEIDVTAAVLGYKQQILAKINYMIDCLRTYEGADRRGYSLFRTPGEIIQEMESRAIEVMKCEGKKIPKKR